MKKAFVSWTRYHRRSDQLARHLGAASHFLQYGRHGALASAPLRYAVQAAQTWRLLRRERPDVVLVQNPPIFAVAVAYLYARLHGARYIIDSHTGAFLSPKWRWSLGLHRLLSRRALTTIVTNEHLYSLVRGWGARATVVGFTPNDGAVARPFPVGGQFNLAVVNTGAEDEPLAAVCEAAARLPEATFYITGDTSRLAAEVGARKPPNCVFTGYLPYEQYVGLLQSVDAVVDLTDRDHTLLMGAFEAVAAGTPLVVSDWPVLRSYFSRGTVHVANTADGLYEGLRRVQRDLPALRREVAALHDQLLAEWRRSRQALLSLMGEDGQAAPGAVAEEHVDAT